MKIIFMGTPQFAVPTLQALHESAHEVCLVVTQPDRPKGRGRRPVACPVKERAEALGYRLMQPASMRGRDTLDALLSLKPDLFVVVAFGHLLNPQLLKVPTHGAINVHASLLPRFRGAAPIQRAILSGETQTGVTTMMLDQGMDTGDMLLSTALPIEDDDTAGSLQDRLSEAGAPLLLETLDRLAAGTLSAVPQDPSQATYAPPLKKAEGRMDWSRTAGELERFIRGMTPWPGAFTFLGERRIKIFRAAVLDEPSPAPPGTVVRGFPDELRVATCEGQLSILELQSASGKRLAVKDFLRGSPIAPGTALA
jgi:methionyl-tRNA formyltransferase